MSQMTEVAFDVNSLVAALEPLLRKIVREELAELVKHQPRLFRLRPTMPLYQDMVELLERKKRNETKFYTHAEVWNEAP